MHFFQMSNSYRAQVGTVRKPPREEPHVVLVVKEGTQRNPRTALLFMVKNAIVVEML